MLEEFADALLKKDSVEFVERITSARVPIVKTKIEGEPVDICFNEYNGLTGVDYVRGYLNKYPEVKYLVVILKYFLKQRSLNETYEGGVGSFLLL
jgi:non-canonical poly(A) RNA polymerase PAPD5/7